MALGAVPGAPRTDKSPTTDMVVWRSADGTSWTGPETIAHDARPTAVTSDGHSFLAVVQLSGLLPSGSISDLTQVLRFTNGNAPRAAAIPLGNEESLNRIFIAGGVLIAAGDHLFLQNGNTLANQGVYDLKGDVGLNDGGYGGTLVNNGVFRKSGGTAR